MIQRALISVSDKEGVVAFARRLHQLKVEILSTGGTAKVLRDAGIPVIDIEDYTGFPEILDGRVKTLHPKVHAGLLARRELHAGVMAREKIPYIDLLVVNFYPFEKTVAAIGCKLDEAVEQIDIGGPAMLRSAAKNYTDVAVVIDPSDYAVVIAELQGQQEIARATRFHLAQKAFAAVARYDAAICNYLSLYTDEATLGNRPATFAMVADKVQDLRYGENPHQAAAWYRTSSTGLSAATQLQGKDLSYNNILDGDAALEMARAFSNGVAAVIVKHANPCGIGIGNTLFGSGALPPFPRNHATLNPAKPGVARSTSEPLREAFLRAHATDPVSSFGGIVALTRPLDGATAEEIAKTFFEVIIAPEFGADALAILEARKNLRLLRVPDAATLPESEEVLRSVQGGLLVQRRDAEFQNVRELRVVTKRMPTDDEYKALDLAWRACHYVKSNAIVFANDTGTVAIGAGQMSRVDSVKLAVMKARLPLKGTVVGSDAFFPFADGLEEAAKAGATAVIQPGGSVKDEEVIAAANTHNMAMIFTGIRHFRH